MNADSTDRLDQDWPYLLTLLPDDLDASAREHRAIRRKRRISDAATLLRLALVFGFCGGSLRETAAWAAEHDIVKLSPVALYKRLRLAADWLGGLLTQTLQKCGAEAPTCPAPLRVRLRDATGLSRPGSKGTDWRLHLDFDLVGLRINDVKLSDCTEGESFDRLPTAPGDLVVGDRGHAHRQGIAGVHQAGGYVLVRLNWQNVPLLNEDGTPLDILAILRELAPGELLDRPVQTAPDAARGLAAVPGRLVAVRKSPEAAEATRRQLRKAARKKGKTPDQRTLEAADYVFFFTTVPSTLMEAWGVLALYRFRWQIEMTFKRMKGIVRLDELTARDDALCRTFIFAKLLGFLLVERLSRHEQAFSPWGYRLRATGFAVAAVSPHDGPRLSRHKSHEGSPTGSARSRCGSGPLPRFATSS
jgi:hypothetical protein